MFEFFAPTKILFGAGISNQLTNVARDLGTRALVVVGRNRDRTSSLLGSLQQAGIAGELFQIEREPTVEIVLSATELARSAGDDLVVGIGGGSVLDAAKAVSALLANPGDPFEHLEVIGRGRPISRPAAPFIAVPTTAGTGSEVTRNAVLASEAHCQKVSLRSPLMFPRVALVDPLLTHSVPRDTTRNTGLDAFTQVLEPFVCVAPTPPVDALCREALFRAGRSLVRVVDDGSDGRAREDMAVVSLFGGLALANAKLGAVHGLAGPIGGMFSAPHGAICAALLPEVVATNVRALQRRGREAEEALRRYDELAEVLTQRPGARAVEAVAFVRDLCARLEVPGLGTFGIGPTDFAAIIERSERASSMAGNPIPLHRDELNEVLTKSM